MGRMVRDRAHPDGNIIRIIELSADYLKRQRRDRERRDG